MTHFQDIFVRNLRFYRTKAGYTQTQFSLRLDISPNYLNAVENGKNFPSTAIVQKILDILNLLPYQLFLEQPELYKNQGDIDKTIALRQELSRMRQQFDHDIERLIAQYCVQK
jgi:transcriptional regulator with XRE-family HTH domain